jgi:hypothetical protein
MTMKQTITKGLGALTPSAWKDIVAVADPTGGFEAQVNKAADGGSRKTFNAVITSSTKDGANVRWTYGWTQVRRTTATLNFAAVANGLTSATNGGKPAINTLEAGNTSVLAYGFTVASSGDLPLAGFTFVAVPNGAVVEMSIVRDSAGVSSFQFSAPNPITGACPAAAIETPIDGGAF